MADFIDRDALEARMHAEFPRLPSGTHGIDVMVRDGFREGFMAGVDAVLALLDAETTEEWGIEWRNEEGEVKVAGYNTKFGATAELADFRVNESDRLVRRRVAVTPWLPSEGGEKP